MTSTSAGRLVDITVVGYECDRVIGHGVEPNANGISALLR